MNATNICKKSKKKQSSSINKLEEHKEEDFIMETEPLVNPRKYAPTVSKGTGIENLDLSWKESTLSHYFENQKVLLMRRDEFKTHYPDKMYQWSQNLEELVMNKSPEEGEFVINTSEYKSPGIDDVALWSEGFLHYWIRYMIDLFGDEWKKNKEIPQEIQLWIYYFLIMMEKPLIPDLAADLNELLGIIEQLNEGLKGSSEREGAGYTMYDSIILVITEHFGQKFQY